LFVRIWLSLSGRREQGSHRRLCGVGTERSDRLALRPL